MNFAPNTPKAKEFKKLFFRGGGDSFFSFSSAGSGLLSLFEPQFHQFSNMLGDFSLEVLNKHRKTPDVYRSKR